MRELQIQQSIDQWVQIALNPSNERGRHYFMSKRTIKKLHGHIWTELPITDEVIEQVEQLGEQVGWPLMMHGPYFEWKPAQLLMEEREEWDAEVAEEIVYDDDDTRNSK